MIDFMQGFKNLRKSKKDLQDKDQLVQPNAGLKRQRLDPENDTLSASSSESDSNI